MLNLKVICKRYPYVSITTLKFPTQRCLNIEIKSVQMTGFHSASVLSTHRYNENVTPVSWHFHFIEQFSLLFYLNLVSYHHQQNYIVVHMRALATWHWTWNKMRRTKQKFLSFSNTIGYGEAGIWEAPHLEHSLFTYTFSYEMVY